MNKDSFSVLNFTIKILVTMECGVSNEIKNKHKEVALHKKESLLSKILMLYVWSLSSMLSFLNIVIL